MCPQAQVRDENVFPRKKLRCVLVHEHVLLRQGLRRLLEDEPDLEVVGEASNAVEELETLSGASCHCNPCRRSAHIEWHESRMTMPA